MYILMIARGYPTAKHPQWGCFEKDQAEALASIGHKVVVVSFDRRFLLEYRTHRMTRFTHNGITYYNQYILPGVTTMLMVKKHKLALDQWIMGQLLRRVIKEQGKPDVIYGQFFFNTVLAIPTCKKEHIPLVGIEHLERFNDTKLDSMTGYQSPIAYRHVDGLIAVSETLRKALMRHFSRDSHVVHNTYGSEFYFAPTTSNNKIRLVATGSLVYRKGFDLLIQALAQANLPAGQWELNIIGNGEERARLQAQIDELHLADSIHLLGKHDKAFIADLLRQSDCFILPSRGENFSVAVLEALACGLPVIASICGGIRECIDERNGLLFEVDDVHGLTQCLEHMAAHYREYDRAAIAADCDARFSPRVIAQQLTEIFEQTITTYHQSSAT